MQNCSAAITILVTLLAISPGFAQSATTIRGRLTHRGKPEAGVKVMIIGIKNMVSTSSDTNGNYRFDGVEPDEYQLVTESSLFVRQGKWAGIEAASLTVTTSQPEITVDLELIRAGIVTGVVRDENGKPSAGKYVQVDRLDESDEVITDDSHERGLYLTDSAGNYRALGLPPGRYRVSAGQGVGTVSPIDETRSAGKRTFYPSTSLANEAAVVEVSGGEEVKHVDIRMLPPFKLYSVSGYVVDATTGDRVSNTTVAFDTLPGKSSSRGEATPSYLVGNDGRFKFTEVRPGTYSLYVASNYSGKASTSTYTGVLQVTVTDQDIDGIELLVHTSTASLSGQVDVDGVSPGELVSDIRLMALVRGAHRAEDARFYYATIEPDGRFTFAGLIPGEASISAMSAGQCPGGLTRLRTERDGQLVKPLFEIRAGENITGVRAYFACGQGRIQGRVTASGSGTRHIAKFRITAVQLNGWSNNMRTPAEIDAQGYFTLENLVEGEYELRAAIVRSAEEVTSDAPEKSVTQRVTVARGQTAQVILRIEVGK
jgi:protocatechuate 3,4-dioxygenase beta subunit